MKCNKCGRTINIQDGLDCDGCNGFFGTDCHDDHPCGTCSDIQSKTIKVVSIEPLTSTIKFQVLDERFSALGTEKWREYIDFKLHDKARQPSRRGKVPSTSDDRPAQSADELPSGPRL